MSKTGAARRKVPRETAAPEELERPGLAARRVAARLLAAVVDKRTSLDGLTDPKGGHPDFLRLEARDRALVRAILTTALRYRGTLAAEIEDRLERPLPKNAAALAHILHVGAAQIRFLSVPDSAAVDLAVAAAEADPRTRRFKGLVNALLRRLSRELGDAPVETPPSLDAPPWLRERLTAQYGPERAEKIFAVHRYPAPIDLTVKSDAGAWAERLGGRVVLPGTVRLAAPDGPISELSGFTEGAWWVQDAAAALPARLLGTELSGQHVADLCAAPGGKTAQLCLTGASVTAVDLSRSRLARLAENLGRLSLEAEILQQEVATWRPERPFDAILLDAPCSSTGTIRRHPDVAFTKNAAEIQKLASVQARLLAAAAGLVRPGGRLVFSNCSLDRAEGEDVVADFLTAHGEWQRDPIRPDEVPGITEAITADGDLRTTPEMLGGAEGPDGGLDGFFAARLRRS